MCCNVDVIIIIINLFSANQIAINYKHCDRTAENCQKSSAYGSMNWPPATMLNATNNKAKEKDNRKIIIKGDSINRLRSEPNRWIDNQQTAVHSHINQWTLVIFRHNTIMCSPTKFRCLPHQKFPCSSLKIAAGYVPKKITTLSTYADTCWTRNMRLLQDQLAKFLQLAHSILWVFL